MTNSNIIEAANLIREFSPATADAFLSQPFNRMKLAVAFDAGFRTHSTFSLKVVAFVLLAVEQDRVPRHINALRRAA